MSEVSGPARYFERALELARQAGSQDEVPVGAVIVDAEGRIIGEGFNLREQNQNPVAHAEILAIQNAAASIGSWRLLGCRLFVTLEPCPMCLAACQQARLERVIYAAHDKKGGALSLGYSLHSDQRMNHRFDVEYHEILECSLVLTEFFSRKRKS